MPKRLAPVDGFQGHYPATINEFNGLWDRGDDENCPRDHWRDCDNIKFIGQNKFGTRDGIDISQTAAGPLGNIVRIYNFPQPTGNTLIMLTYDGVNGKIYHQVNATTVYGPLLTIAGMTDFSFVPYAGRAYITPFTSFSVNGLNLEKGLQSEFLYVYKGDGTAARKAAGTTPAGNLTVNNGAAGHTDPGFKVFGVVGETDTGFLSAPCAFASFTTGAALSVSFTTIPLFAGTQWVKRHIVSTININDFDGNLDSHQFFFIPGAVINDNTSGGLANQSFYDADLLDDASHLLNNYSSIPAGATIALYHNRLCLATTYTDISILLISAEGEPEAIDQVDGITIVVPDGNPITNLQELRDVLYVFKRTKTTSFIDNGDVPSTWKESGIDNALGTSVHGIATVLDSGSNSIDYLIIATYQGVSIFAGKYIVPELSWKIDNLWKNLNLNEFRKIQIVNNPIEKEFYIVSPTSTIIVGNYSNGMAPKTMRWTKWSFSISANTIAIVNITTLIIGSDNS